MSNLINKQIIDSETIKEQSVKYAESAANITKGSGEGSVQQIGTQASGEYSHAEGKYSVATGFAAHAEGGGASEATNPLAGTWKFNDTNITPIGDSNGMDIIDITFTTENGETYSGMCTGEIDIPEEHHYELILFFGDTNTEGGGYSEPYCRGYGISYEGSPYSYDDWVDGYQTINVIVPPSAEEDIAWLKANATQLSSTSPSIASGDYSHAEGEGTVASGYGSHAEGGYTIASGGWQHVQGKYNVEDPESVHIVGWGTSPTDRKNIHTISKTGDGWFAGNVLIGANNELLATQTYVDSLVGDISAALDELHEYTQALINGGTADNLITFSIDGAGEGMSLDSFEAVKGMTWGEWVNSDFNKEETFQITELTNEGNPYYAIVHNKHGMWVEEIKDGVSRLVSQNDVIVEGYVYGLAA